MRKLSSPDFFADESGGPLPYPLFWSDSDPTVSGPFTTGEDLILGLARKSRKNQHNQKHSYYADCFERRLARTLDSYPPSFSHSHLQWKNIIIQDILPDDCSSAKDFAECSRAQICQIECYWGGLDLWAYSGFHFPFLEHHVHGSSSLGLDCNLALPKLSQTSVFKYKFDAKPVLHAEDIL
jgi:hypothetical protein